MTTPMNAGASLRLHWPEYLIEAWALGMFMLSAGAVTTLFEYPHSPLHQAIVNADLRRALIGIAMGLTAMALIYSSWGQRSGAHMNPAVTLTFLRLKKIARWDAFFYIAAQFIGGTLGVLLLQEFIGGAFTAMPVNYVVTSPGVHGALIAFGAEIIISALLMTVILHASTSSYAKLTGIFAGFLVASYIGIEAPLSGMSMNPARSFASALPAQLWTSFWIYLTAPVLGMQLAAALYLLHGKRRALACAKLIHGKQQRCIHCGYEPNHPAMAAPELKQGDIT